MNRKQTMEAGSAAGICVRALALAIADIRNGYEQEQNRIELEAHLATQPICGKPGRGFKAWNKKCKALHEESEMIYGNNLAHAIYNYTSANDMMFRPSDLREGRTDEMRRQRKQERHENMERAHAFALEYYNPAEDE